MGNLMGSYYATREVGLEMDATPTFDPQVGFETKRKDRVMIAKEEDLISSRIEPDDRDYCSHYLMAFQQCRYKNWPLLYKCAHEKHDYLNCQQADYVMRMKEFEREHRLRLREQRLAAAA